MNEKIASTILRTIIFIGSCFLISGIANGITTLLGQEGYFIRFMIIFALSIPNGLFFLKYTEKLSDMTFDLLDKFSEEKPE